MQAVFVDSDITRVAFARNLLESEGIACCIRNEHTRTLGVSILGFSHTHLLDPVLCVLDDSQAAAAVEIVRANFGTAPQSSLDWTCPACNEANPATFDVCWQCGAARPQQNPPLP